MFLSSTSRLCFKIVDNIDKYNYLPELKKKYSYEFSLVSAGCSLADQQDKTACTVFLYL